MWRFAVIGQVTFGLTVLIGGGCASRSVDASSSVAFDPGPSFVSEPDLAASFGGSVRSVYYTESEGESSRVIVSFDPRADEARFASLNAFAASVDSAFRGIYPDRLLGILDVGSTGALTEAELPFVVLAYSQPVPAEGERASSICDAAALLIEAPDGYWTVSWNASRGTLADSQSTLTAFLEGARFGR
ncbi:MAG: hypothetical protein AAGI53_11035 [Planctomycetota bacterium]